MALSSTKVNIWNKALVKIGESLLIESEDEDRPAAAVCRAIWDDCFREFLEAAYWPWAVRQQQLTEVTDQETTVAYAASVSDTVFDIPFAYLNADQVVVTHIDSDGAETELTLDTDYTLTIPDPDPDALTQGQVTLVVALVADESVKIEVSTSRHGWLYIYGLPSDYINPIAILQTNGSRTSLIPSECKIRYEVMLDDGQDGYILCTDLPAADLAALEYICDVTNLAIIPRYAIEALSWRIAQELALGHKKDTQKSDYCRKMYSDTLSAAAARSQNVGEPGSPISPSVRARV